MLTIRSKTMLSGSHSWAITMKNLLSCWERQGHKLYLSSINGNENIPDNLKNRLGEEIEDPDIDICYTVPYQFGKRFQEKSKRKLAIYNYETSILPQKWANEINHIDYVLPSSNFSKEIFVNAGWPEEKCIVIPHGINLDDFKNKKIYPLKSNKKFKFLNISIPHYRKNVDMLLESYYSTFSEKDDVCLVLKTSSDYPCPYCGGTMKIGAKNTGLPPSVKVRGSQNKILPLGCLNKNEKCGYGRSFYSFECDIRKPIIQAQKKYKNKKDGLPHLELLFGYLDDMIPLYNACDVIINTASSEGFGIPLLEGLAANKLVIAPRCSGQLDFLNDKNSLLVDVKIIKAESKYQYWQPTEGAQTYLPEIDDLKRAMLEAYQNYQSLQDKFKEERERTVQEFTWEKAAQKILEIR